MAIETDKAKAQEQARVYVGTGVLTTNGIPNATREPTIREHLLSRIYEAERVARSLTDLMNNLPSSFLECGLSRLSPLLNPKV